MTHDSTLSEAIATVVDMSIRHGMTPEAIQRACQIVGKLTGIEPSFLEVQVSGTLDDMFE